jgi:hypothetical protein
MPPALVAALFGVGFATWVYTKIMRTTGGNTQNSLVVAGIAAVFAFIMMLLILNFVDRLLA